MLKRNVEQGDVVFYRPRRRRIRILATSEFISSRSSAWRLRIGAKSASLACASSIARASSWIASSCFSASAKKMGEAL